MEPTQAKAGADAATTAAKQALQLLNTELVYAGLVFVVIMTILTLIALKSTKVTHDFETQKLRFAAVTFTGILTLFVFSATVYMAGGNDTPGSVIFEKGLTAMFTLAGTVVGYLFGSAAKVNGVVAASAPSGDGGGGAATTAPPPPATAGTPAVEAPKA